MLSIEREVKKHLICSVNKIRITFESAYLGQKSRDIERKIYLEFNQQRYNIPIKNTHQTTAFGRSRHSRRQQLPREMGSALAPSAPLHM